MCVTEDDQLRPEGLDVRCIRGVCKFPKSSEALAFGDWEIEVQVPFSVV